jgi:hypothetical protein
MSPRPLTITTGICTRTPLCHRLLPMAETMTDIIPEGVKTRKTSILTQVHGNTSAMHR